VDYFILLLAVLCIAVQFSINKVYQKNFAHGLKDMLFFPLVCGVVNVILFILLSFIFYGKFPELTLFSFVMSVVLSVVGTLSALVGILILKYGKMSVYSVFMMLGGMILPYFYGVFFLSESISVFRIIGLFILICALPCSAIDFKGKNKNNKDNINEKNTRLKAYYMLCIFIFLLNGATSIISKMHSINGSAVPAANFIVYANLWSAVINFIAYFIFSRHLKKSQKRENTPEPNRNAFHAVLTITIYAAVAGLGFLFQLISAETVPAVALYPIVTGGSIVLSAALAAIFFKEKISIPGFAGIIMSLCGTLLFLIQ